MSLRNRLRLSLVLQLSAAIVCSMPSAAAGPEIVDPILIFHPRGSCESEIIEIEVWDRAAESWRPHPRHHRVLADTCHLEDAGGLLNEIRTRCFVPGSAARPSEREWKVGYSVDQIRLLVNCPVPDATTSGKRNSRITLDTPPARKPIKNLEARAKLEGSVDLARDIAVLIDASFDAETREIVTETLRRRAAELAPQLGATRIAVESFGRHNTGWASSRNATRSTIGLPFNDSPERVSKAIDRVAKERDPARTPDLVDRLARARRALQELPKKGARQGVVVVANAHAEVPFGEEVGKKPRYREQILEQISILRARAVMVQIFAIGKEEADLNAFADRIRERIGPDPSRGSVVTVPDPIAFESEVNAIPLPGLVSLVVVNLSNGVLAEQVEFEAGGGFTGEVTLDDGSNRLQVRALLSDGQELAADFDREFDNSLLLERERARMEELRRREGHVELDVEVD